MEFPQIKDYIIETYKKEELPYVYEKLEDGTVIKISLTRSALSVEQVNPDVIVRKLEDAQHEKNIIAELMPEFFEKEVPVVLEENEEGESVVVSVPDGEDIFVGDVVDVLAEDAEASTKEIVL